MIEGQRKNTGKGGRVGVVETFKLVSHAKGELMFALEPQHVVDQCIIVGDGELG